MPIKIKEISLIIRVKILFFIMVLSCLISTNGQVLLQVGYFITSSPELLPKLEYKIEVNSKKPDKYSSAGIKVQRCKQPKFQRPAPLVATPLRINKGICATNCVYLCFGRTYSGLPGMMKLSATISVTCFACRLYSRRCVFSTCFFKWP